MGKKAAPAPPPVEQEPEEVKKVEEPTEILEGDFVFPDGSTYTGQYLKKGEEVVIHGEGELRNGPETFKGIFQKGLYKAGHFTSCSGATYSGTFKGTLFHGVGEYRWPDGRVYKGTWRDGFMHGRGQYLNFSIGADQCFVGYSLRGHFASSRREQEEARRAFLADYAAEASGSASAALRELLEKTTAEGVPAQFIVPSVAAPPGGEEPSPEVLAERAAVEDIVLGPFPAASSIVQASAQAFLARLGEAAAKPLQVSVYEDADRAKRFDGRRLKRPQLQLVGQAVEFYGPDAEVGALSLVVLVNVSAEHDPAAARWKLVDCEVVPPTTS